MRLIVGLGNPGEKYASTRHNVGWQALDLINHHYLLPAYTHKKEWTAEVSAGEIAQEKVVLVKPQTYMNLSGEAVSKIVN